MSVTEKQKSKPLFRLFKGNLLSFRPLVVLKSNLFNSWWSGFCVYAHVDTQEKNPHPAVSLMLFCWLTVTGSKATRDLAMPRQRQWRRLQNNMDVTKNNNKNILRNMAKFIRGWKCNQCCLKDKHNTFFGENKLQTGNLLQENSTGNL